MPLLLRLSHFSRVWPHRRQPTRLPRPWDSPGKNSGVGCHFLLQCMKVKSESEVAQSCLTLGDPVDSSPPGSSTHGTLRARALEWGASYCSRGHYSGSWWWTGKHGGLQSMGSQRVRHDWAAELAPGDHPDAAVALTGRSFTTVPPGNRPPKTSDAS